MTEMGAMPQTPELDRQAEIIKSGRAGTIQDFIDWLREEKHYVLARYVPESERFGDDGIYGEQPVEVLIQPLELMADFFGIDLRKIENERRAILAEIQRRNQP
jgi:hypothetical protein